MWHRRGEIRPKFEDVLFPPFSVRTGEDILTANREPALLQDTDRRGIVLRDVGKERPRFHQLQELCQGRAGDALAPVPLAEPVTASALTFRLPTDDVPGHMALEDDGPNDANVVRH